MRRGHLVGRLERQRQSGSGKEERQRRHCNFDDRLPLVVVDLDPKFLHVIFVLESGHLGAELPADPVVEQVHVSHQGVPILLLGLRVDLEPQNFGVAQVLACRLELRLCDRHGGYLGNGTS